MVDKLEFKPQQASYSVQYGETTARSQIAGGVGRYRKTFDNASQTVTATWTLDSQQFQAFRGFFTSVISEGSLPFLIDLIIDDQELEERTAYFIPGTFSVSKIRGDLHEITAELEVAPIATTDDTEDFGAGYYASIAAYGSEAAALDVYNQLETLVNVDMPTFIGP